MLTLRDSAAIILKSNSKTNLVNFFPYIENMLSNPTTLTYGKMYNLHKLPSSVYYFNVRF